MLPAEKMPTTTIKSITSAKVDNHTSPAVARDLMKDAVGGNMRNFEVAVSAVAAPGIFSKR